MRKLAKGLVLTAFAAAGAAQAHVTVQPKIALPGAQETLRFVVGHGCDGQPTTGLRVDFPAGVDQIQPQPKPGWSVNVQKSPAGAVEVIWTGGVFGPKAPDSFEVAAKLPARTGVLAFPAFQSCGPTVTGWTEAATPDVPKPAHPVPVLTLTPEAAAAASAFPPSAMPKGVTVRDGVLIDPSGLPLYTFDYDNMIGMSHCVGGCASTWRPFEASAAAKPVGDWALIGRDDGSVQWTYKTKPLYTNAQDQPGAAGQSRANWRLAR
jgi:predicted lipoprotein with Yx(FWY)xxD motif